MLPTQLLLVAGLVSVVGIRGDDVLNGVRRVNCGFVGFTPCPPGPLTLRASGFCGRRHREGRCSGIGGDTGVGAHIGHASMRRTRELRVVGVGRVGMQAQLETKSFRSWLEKAKLVTDLRTDDGYLVAEVTTRFGDVGTRSRSNWVRSLLQMFSSQILSRISSRLVLTSAWSAYISAVYLYGSQLAEDVWEVTRFDVPGWPFELVGGFLSILVVFRTDQAYGRFWEARQHWASCSAACKSVARLALANLPPKLALEFIALVAIFPTALRQHLRGQVNKEEMEAIFNLYCDTREAKAGSDGFTSLDVITRSKNMPMTILLALSCLAAPLRNRPSARVFNYEILWEQLESLFSELTNIVSACEKLKCTPIPLSYSRHTSRFFSLFLLSLPFSLVKTTSPLLVVGIVAAVSWVLFSTDEIGHLIEEPFGTQSERESKSGVLANVMSRRQLAQVFERLDPGADGCVAMSSLLTLPRVLQHIGLSIPPSSISELQALGQLAQAAGGDVKVSFENFRLMWVFTANDLRGDRMETLPLSSMCDTINRDLFALCVAQRQAVGCGLVGERAKLDGDALRKLNLWSPETRGGGVSGWDREAVERWLLTVHLERFSSIFQENDIDGAALVTLTSNDLQEMQIVSLLDQSALITAIEDLKTRGEEAKES